MYYLELKADPVNAIWRRVTPATIPAANYSNAAMIYDPDDDVLFTYGYDGSAGTHNNWVYCRTAENPVTGTLTAKQAAAGCRQPDDWSEVAPAGGVQPPGMQFPGMVYDLATKKALLYGGGLPNGTTFYNQTWAYDVPTQTWVQKALSTTPPPVYTGSWTAQPSMVYNTRTKKVLFRQVANTGAPADWQYDPVLDAWQKLVSTGGPAYDQSTAYDALNNRLISWSQNPNTGQAEIWQGQLPGSGNSRMYRS
jgi:hypothetical protein